VTDTTVPQIPLKRCSLCKEPFPPTREYFYFRREKPEARCKKCHCLKTGEYQRVHRQRSNQMKRQWAERNTESRQESCRKYLRVHPERRQETTKRYYESHKEERSAYNKQYAQNNPEKIKAKHLRYRTNSPEKANAKCRRWRQRNKEYNRTQLSKRRARLLNAGGEHTANDIRLLLKTQLHKCWWCGAKLKGREYHVDHRIPLVRGGSNDAANLCISCPKCNLSKGSKLPQEWNGRLL
jgi:5-methylcytosine-specific restriction endonuclease McrA